MAFVRNISAGYRGAYLGGALVMADPGEVIEADDFCDEWFAEVEADEAPQGDTDGDAEGDASAEPEGGEVPAPARRGRPPKAKPEGEAE